MGTANAAHTQEDDEQAIRALVDRWLTATAAGDVDMVLRLMSDDVVFMAPGREPFGKEVFRAQSEELKDVKVEAKAHIQEIQVIGDDAWMRNRLEVTIAAPNGEQAKRSGYTLTILRKQKDGNWVIIRDANLVS